jgi:hypothetical protein
MRRLICVCTLLGRLCGQSYVWTLRAPQRPVPVVWQLPSDGSAGTTLAWWIIS